MIEDGGCEGALEPMDGGDVPSMVVSESDASPDEALKDDDDEAMEDADEDDPDAIEHELFAADEDDDEDDGVMDMSELAVGHAGDDVGAIVSGDVGSMAVDDEIDALAQPPGEEASASDAPPPLVPAPPPAAPPLPPPTMIHQYFLVGGGKVTFYPGNMSSPNGFFEAVCGDPRHGCRCRKTRVAVEAPEGSKKFLSQGRPLGFLVAWLDAHELAENRDEHSKWMPCLATRQAARHKLEQCKDPNSAFVLACERPPRAGEPREPLECP